MDNRLPLRIWAARSSRSVLLTLLISSILDSLYIFMKGHKESAPSIPCILETRLSPNGLYNATIYKEKGTPIQAYPPIPRGRSLKLVGDYLVSNLLEFSIQILLPAMSCMLHSEVLHASAKIQNVCEWVSTFSIFFVPRSGCGYSPRRKFVNCAEKNHGTRGFAFQRRPSFGGIMAIVLWNEGHRFL